MEYMIPILISLGLFAAIAVPIYENIRSKHRERMALIEKGIVTEDVKYLYSGSPERGNPYGALKWGLILLFVGLALMLAILLSSFLKTDESLYFSLISIGAGVALLVYYRIALKRQREGELV
jgi:hypothetical protein